jgi:short chain dehydrogenase
VAEQRSQRTKEKAAAVKGIERNVTGVQGDVSNLGDLDRLFAQIKREKGKLDILFANAGVATFAPFGTITEEFYDSIFNINVGNAQPRRACAAVRPRRPCGKAQRVHDGVRKAGYLGDVGLIITKLVLVSVLEASERRVDRTQGRRRHRTTPCRKFQRRSTPKLHSHAPSSKESQMPGHSCPSTAKRTRLRACYANFIGASWAEGNQS